VTPQTPIIKDKRAVAARTRLLLARRKSKIKTEGSIAAIAPFSTKKEK